MLVLSRKTNEQVRIGDDITIQVVDIRGDKVRFGVAAPNGVPIHREEVYQAIKRDGGRMDRKLDDVDGRSLLEKLNDVKELVARARAEMERAEEVACKMLGCQPGDGSPIAEAAFDLIYNDAKTELVVKTFLANQTETASEIVMRNYLGGPC